MCACVRRTAFVGAVEETQTMRADRLVVCSCVRRYYVRLVCRVMCLSRILAGSSTKEVQEATTGAAVPARSSFFHSSTLVAQWCTAFLLLRDRDRKDNAEEGTTQRESDCVRASK